MATTTAPFQNLGRNDDIDTTQRNLDNTRYADYIMSNFTQNIASTEHVDFATKQPDIMFNGLTNGLGLNPDNVDADTFLQLQKTQARSHEKVQLYQRPFVTVPYMGKGFGNPVLETQLLQGESTVHMKSVGTIMEQSFMPYSVMPVDGDMQEHVANPKYTVEEAALRGWVRGGSGTRD
jgi:hypothetical protein